MSAKLLNFDHVTIGPILQKDIHTLVHYGQPSDAATLYLEAGERARGIFEGNFAELDERRRATLNEAIASIAKTLPPERQP